MKPLARFPRTSASICAALILGGACAAPQAARLVHDSLPGPVTGTTVRFTVALPDDYDPAQGPYPVVYHLHGIGGNEQGNQVTAVPRSFEAARAKGLIGPVVVVFPDGLVNSFWADSKDGSKPAETRILRELMPHIESAYQVRTDRGGRFIQGFSMGGFGAAKFLAKHPGLFRAGALYDGALLDWNALRQRHPALVTSLFGDDRAYAARYIPHDLVAAEAEAAAEVPVRMAVGALLQENRAYRDTLQAHGIAPDYRETGCEHVLPCHLEAEGENTARLYGSLLSDTLPPDPDPVPSGWVVTGDPRSQAGATWTFRGTRDGVAYDLQGILFSPATGAGPFGGVVVSHGKGGNARNYGAGIARTMRDWGLVVIATNYTHAVGVPLGAPGTAADEGAREPNLLRARMALELLRSLPQVDDGRIAAHGHSMGAFVTGGLVGTTAGFRAASHTAGGVAPKDGFAATTRAQAAGIRVPYQMHHGDIDNTVPLSHDQRLDSILAAHRVTRDLRTYTGFDHGDIPLDAVMLGRVKTWYAAHGVLDPVATRSAVPVLRNPAVRPGKQETARRNLLGRKVGAEGRRPD